MYRRPLGRKRSAGAESAARCEVVDPSPRRARARRFGHLLDASSRAAAARGSHDHALGAPTREVATTRQLAPGRRRPLDAAAGPGRPRPRAPNRSVRWGGARPVQEPTGLVQRRPRAGSPPRGSLRAGAGAGGHAFDAALVTQARQKGIETCHSSEERIRTGPPAAGRRSDARARDPEVRAVGSRIAAEEGGACPALPRRSPLARAEGSAAKCPNRAVSGSGKPR